MMTTKDPSLCARLLDELPETARANVLIEVEHPSHEQPLREPPDVGVTWVVSTGGEPTGSALLYAVHAADWLEGDEDAHERPLRLGCQVSSSLIVLEMTSPMRSSTTI